MRYDQVVGVGHGDVKAGAAIMSNIDRKRLFR